MENSKPTILHISERTDMNKTIAKNEKLAETFHSFFSSMVDDNIKMEYDIDTLASIPVYQDSVFRAIKKLKHHPIILKIQNF